MVGSSVSENQTGGTEGYVSCGTIQGKELIIRNFVLTYRDISVYFVFFTILSNKSASKFINGSTDYLKALVVFGEGEL